MHYVINSEKMRSIEYKTIEHYGIDAMLLMEHAALSVAERIKEVLNNNLYNIDLKTPTALYLSKTKRITNYQAVPKMNLSAKNNRILFVCGIGNNGGDGIAAARILFCQGYRVKILLLGDEEKATLQVKKQLTIIKKLSPSMINIPLINSMESKPEDKQFGFYPDFNWEEYDIIVDAIFGLGFHGIPNGIYKDSIIKINSMKAYVISVDIPSGIYADTGEKKGEAVFADETVTFGVCKLGLLLYPGAEHAGNVLIADIGFPKQLIQDMCKNNSYQFFEKEDVLYKLPRRNAYSNKGSYGKVLVIAGSANSPGAAYLTASAAYRMGAGLVKVLVPKEGIHVINTNLPEALTTVYDDDDFKDKVIEALEWSSVVVIGPGIGKNYASKRILDIILKQCNKPLVADADALNILSDILNEENVLNYLNRIERIAKLLPSNTIVTPHLKELSRLLNLSVKEIYESLIDIEIKCTYNNNLIYVIKDTRTIVSSNEMKYINLSGNDGMATGGSGDVLSGIIAGLISGGMSGAEAAGLGVYLHGLAGDIAANEKGRYSMLASDIVDAVSKVMNMHIYTESSKKL